MLTKRIVILKIFFCNEHGLYIMTKTMYYTKQIAGLDYTNFKYFLREKSTKFLMNKSVKFKSVQIPTDVQL